MIESLKSQIVMPIKWYNTIALFYNISKVHSIRELKSYLTLVCEDEEWISFHSSKKSPVTESQFFCFLHFLRYDLKYSQVNRSFCNSSTLSSKFQCFLHCLTNFVWSRRGAKHAFVKENFVTIVKSTFDCMTSN